MKKQATSLLGGGCKCKVRVGKKTKKMEWDGKYSRGQFRLFEQLIRPPRLGDNLSPVQRH